MEKLFSYGTLQLEKVQIETFGRKLVGRPDVLTRYKLEKIQIKDPSVLAASNQEIHPILRFTGNNSDRIEGVVFEVTNDELLQADVYEEQNYKRVLELFESGLRAWVYVENL